MKVGVDVAVNLSGSPPSERLSVLFEEARKGPRQMLVFTGVEWRALRHPRFSEGIAADLKVAVGQGARGLKISKILGLRIPNEDGSLMPVDDPRLDELWRTAGELGVPVAIHTGDPVAFFEAPTPSNERWEELKDHPSWSFYGDEFPSLTELLAQRDRMVAKHPQTTFVAVHVGGLPEDLGAVARSMRASSNLWIDLAARIPEIGRHDPELVREFFEEFQDRILFGTDLQVSSRRVILGSAGDDEKPGVADAVEYYRVHFDYLETRRRGIVHRTPIQGRWTIDGIGLSKPVLDKIYRENARRLLKLE